MSPTHTTNRTLGRARLGCPPGTRRRSGARGFSVIEMIIAIGISGALLAGSMAALDASFKAYKITTESASTHVISRIVMHRLSSMIRVGTDFGPYPSDPLDPAQNPVISSTIEFTSGLDNTGDPLISVISVVTDPLATDGTDMLVLEVFEDGAGSGQQVLMRGVQDATFILEYDLGPRLRRATIDLTVLPNDYQDASFGSVIATPSIRFVASAVPRKLVDSEF